MESFAKVVFRVNPVSSCSFSPRMCCRDERVESHRGLNTFSHLLLMASHDCYLTISRLDQLHTANQSHHYTVYMEVAVSHVKSVGA